MANVPLQVKIRRLELEIEELKISINACGDIPKQRAARIMMQTGLDRRVKAVDYLDNTYPPPIDIIWEQIQQKFKTGYHCFRKV